MSFTKKMIENEHLLNSAYFTVLNEFQKRAETPKKQCSVSIWDMDGKNMNQDISENESKYDQLSKSSETHKMCDGNFSVVPNMYDINEQEVGIFVDCTPLEDSVESYTDVDDLFDTSILDVNPEYKIPEKKFQPPLLPNCSSPIDDMPMDITDELYISQVNTLINGSSKLVTNGDLTSSELKVLHKVANDYSCVIKDCKRDLTTPEKNVPTKRQCVDSKNTDLEKISSVVKSNLNDKYEVCGKTSVEHIPQLISSAPNVKSKSSNEDCLKLPQAENKCSTEKITDIKNISMEESISKQKKLPCLSQVSKNISSIEKKCLELKALQMNLNEQCEWRKREPKQFISKKEKLKDECSYTSYSVTSEKISRSSLESRSYSNWLREREQNTNMVKTIEFTSKNTFESAIIEQSFAESSAKLSAARCYDGLSVTESSDKFSVAGSSDKLSVAGSSGKLSVGSSDKLSFVGNSTQLFGTKNSAVGRCIGSKAEHCDVKKAQGSSMSKLKYPVMSKAELMSKKKSSCTKTEKNESVKNKAPTSVTPPEFDDVMVNLLVIGRNRNSELAVRRQVFERLRSRSPKIAEFIPPVDSNERTVDYSLDATITFLRCLFSAPYNVSSWKVALEAISMAKVYNLPNLHDTCMQYFKSNFPHDDVDQVVEYARHFKIIEDFIDIEEFNTRNIFSENDTDKPRIFTYTCSISTTLIVDPSEFCIPLSLTQQFMGSMFEADIKNDLSFEAISGCFSITGIQLKLKNGIVGNARKNVVYSVTKKNKRLISDTKEKPFKSLIIINFNKKVTVKPKETVKISLMIEDIQAGLCYTTPRLKLAEKTDTTHFRISLSSNKNQEKFRKPLFFIEKLFYSLSI